MFWRAAHAHILARSDLPLEASTMSLVMAPRRVSSRMDPALLYARMYAASAAISLPRTLVGEFCTGLWKVSISPTTSSTPAWRTMSRTLGLSTVMRYRHSRVMIFRARDDWMSTKVSASTLTPPYRMTSLWILTVPVRAPAPHQRAPAQAGMGEHSTARTFCRRALDQAVVPRLEEACQRLGSMPFLVRIRFVRPEDFEVQPHLCEVERMHIRVTRRGGRWGGARGIERTRSGLIRVLGPIPPLLHHLLLHTDGRLLIGCAAGDRGERDRGGEERHHERLG
mmetsp:Transcript_50031/g.160108  ORF Transcript_50031/g.160108 Transcript_50031/m.160108 type:complete len:281 (-) Transcript_50031:57-899(-)